MSISLKKHHEKRLKQRRKDYWGASPLRKLTVQEEARRLGKLLQYPKICSCHMCANRRKFEGITIKERSAIEMEKVDVKNEQRLELSTGQDEA